MTTHQDTFDHIIGAGAFTFPWWAGTVTTGYHRASGDADPDWTVRVTTTDEDIPGRPLRFLVSHEVIMAACARVADGIVSASPDLREQCRALLHDPQGADFDAVTSDALLQVIAFGEIIYG